jgi:hypothetical protein
MDGSLEQDSPTPDYLIAARTDEGLYSAFKITQEYRNLSPWL